MEFVRNAMESSILAFGEGGKSSSVHVVANAVLSFG